MRCSARRQTLSPPPPLNPLPRLELAEVMFRKALRSDPRHLPSKCALAMLYGARGDIPEASNLFRTVLASDPGHVEALCGLASVNHRPPYGA